MDNGFLAIIMALTLCCPIVEIRQYTLTQGSFHNFRTLFEQNFIESQEADGITIVGTFRVLDDPNRFFWIRGFQNMDARRDALTAFYGGPVWKAHRNVANSMLVENDNVLLLHPARANSGIAVDTAVRPGLGAKDPRPGLMVATIYALGSVDARTFDETFEATIRPELTAAGARVLATLATEHSENTFPHLPVRENANVYVWLSCFPDTGAYDRYRVSVNASPAWAKTREQLALWHMYSPPEVWRLEATPRSALHC